VVLLREVAAGVIVDEVAARDRPVGVLREVEPLAPVWVSQGLGGEGAIAEEDAVAACDDLEEIPRATDLRLRTFRCTTI
jgi:hypothetical protein